MNSIQQEAILNHLEKHGKVTYTQIRALYVTKNHTDQIIQWLIMSQKMKLSSEGGGLFVRY